MANPFLIVVTVILALAIIAGSIYILVYFQHPEDRLVAWGPKIVVVLSLSLACFSVLMLPLDVGNGSTNGGFPMATLWMIVFIFMAILIVVIIPFATFYYEGDEYDDTGKAPSQLGSAIKGTLISILVYAVIFIIMYLFLGIAEIPVIRIENTLRTTHCRELQSNVTIDGVDVPEVPVSCEDLNRTQTIFFNSISANASIIGNRTVTNVTNGDGTYSDIIVFSNGTVLFLSNDTLFTQQNTTASNNFTVIVFDQTVCCYNTTNNITVPDIGALAGKVRHHETVQFRVSIALFIISIIVFFGWILFILFGGIGMVAMPYDCITSWGRRPVRISLDKYVVRKKEIGDQATKLIEKGKAIQERQKKGKERKRDRRNYNKFRQAVFILEDEYERLQQCYKLQGGKLILHFLTLVWGIISVGLTVMWMLHIILYIITYPYPFSPFLNTMLIELDDAFGLLGTAAYGLFSFYLLVCCIKGNFKFGMRLFFLFPIHPMRVGNTLMSAFLFNCSLILICCFAVVQFCTTAFNDYTSQNTAINAMFALSVNHLKGLKYIFIGYIYALIIMVGLTAIYFGVKPKDKPAIDQIKI